MILPTRQLRHVIVSSATILNLLVIASNPVGAAGPGGAPIPPPPAFTSPDIKPTFADWITAHPIALAKKIALTDPLLKPPFAAAPPGSLKGMAAGIRAVQLDIPNRVKAVRYLGTVDCVTYPDAQDMLIATMQEDPSEEVRYEAVMALRNMLTRGCCNMGSACECDTCCNRKKIVRDTERHAKKGKNALVKEAKCKAKIVAIKAQRKAEAEDERYDCCRGCANEKVMKALAKVAFEKDDQCCWIEPSERVRAAAAEAMCLFKDYADGYSLPDPDSDPTLNSDDDMDKDDKQKEAAPANDSEAAPEPKPDAKESSAAKQQGGSSSAISNQSIPTPGLAQIQAVTPAVQPSAPVLKSEPDPVLSPVIPGLKGRCIVALKARQILPVDSQYSSVFEERTYYFSTADAKAAFDSNPKNFAPAYGGIDPVAWLSQRQMQDGQHLREFNGQFFLFSSKENWETFKGNPNRYVLRSNETNVRTVSNN